MRCPICKRLLPENDRDKPGSVYPFCSERCKLVDLGRWLDGRYQVPVAGDSEDETDPLPPLQSDE